MIIRWFLSHLTLFFALFVLGFLLFNLFQKHLILEQDKFLANDNGSVLVEKNNTGISAVRDTVQNITNTIISVADNKDERISKEINVKENILSATLRKPIIEVKNPEKQTEQVFVSDKQTIDDLVSLLMSDNHLFTSVSSTNRQIGSPAIKNKKVQLNINGT